ncbi:MAG TPA: histidine kinase dimerization/phosphoacceptor domain -containing protein [Verrucomicrobiae bacterium]
MDSQLHILLVEDDQNDVMLIDMHLRRSGMNFLLHHVRRREDFIRALQTLRYDVILCDFTLPGLTGLDALETAQQLAQGTPCLIVTGSINEETAVECMKAGASDYVLKNHIGRLPQAILTTLQRHKAELEREKAVEAVRESEKRFRMLADSAPTLIWMAGSVGEFIYFNQPWLDFTGKTLESQLGDGWLSCVHPDDAQKAMMQYLNAFHDAKPFDLEYRLKRKDGVYRWFLNRGQPRLVGDNKLVGYIGSCIDITERKEAEQRLSDSLHEKEVLLQEVHHRVKNNMQVISSLFSLAASQQSNPVVSAMLRENQNRVQSMALVHEKFYRKTDLAKVDFQDYLHDLVTHLFRSFGAVGRVHYVLQTEPVQLTVDSAIPCGLIANELLSNALKHAFPQGRQGTVTVQLGTNGDGVAQMCISDDGLGLPSEFDTKRGNTLGLQLVRTLTDQLGGQIEVLRQPNTSFRINFPSPAANNRSSIV